MAKKIYDIKPPKMAKSKTVQEKFPEESSGKIRVKKVVYAAPRQTHARSKKEKRSVWWPVSIFILAVVLIAGIYLFFKLPKADITIWPSVDTLSFTQTVTANKSADSVDLTNAVIPVQYFQATKTGSQDFPATGNADNTGLASGVVTIFNKCNPTEPLSIAKGINFLSDGGKVFTTVQKKFIVPAATTKGGKIVPSSIQMNVQASQGGDSYNIAPSTFSAPGLNGTVYFSCIYATSAKAMTGGYAGKVKKVTDDDIQGAKDVLTKKVTSDAVSALKSQISSDYVLLDNAVLTNVTNASTPTKSGTVAENFNYSLTVQTSALAFKKSDLDQFAKNYIISQMPDGKTLLDNSFKITYSASTVDVSGGKATLNLNFSAGVYQNVDKNSLTLSMLGENANQIKQTVNNSLGNQVTKIDVKFWPFWVVSAPNNQSAVKINLKFQ